MIWMRWTPKELYDLEECAIDHALSAKSKAEAWEWQQMGERARALQEEQAAFEHRFMCQMLAATREHRD